MSKKHKKNSDARSADSGSVADELDSVEKSERDALAAIPPDVYTPEDQTQRWMKYGANVVLTVVVVLLLAAIVIWATNSERIPLGKNSVTLKARKDLTSDSTNELKPQTKEIVKGLDKEVTLVSLYPKLKKEEAANAGTDTYQKVLDILDEYKRNGTKISVEAIDPVNDPDEVAGWLARLKQKYGKNTAEYEKFLKEVAPKAIEGIKTKAEAEVTEIGKLAEQVPTFEKSLKPEQIQKLNTVIGGAANTIAGMPEMLESLSESSKRFLDEKIPDYASAVKLLRNGTLAMRQGMLLRIPGLGTVSRSCGEIAEELGSLKDDQAMPEVVRNYARDAAPRYTALKAVADEALKQADALGELKLDQVRKKLIPAEEGATTPPAIAIMGPDDVKVIENKDLWTSGQSTGLTNPGSQKPRMRFSGEQQLTSSILALAQPTRTKIAFVRAGGEPLTAGGGMFGQSAPFQLIADRLRSYNFEVVEKDFGPPRGPQQPPDETDVTGAIWVVFASANRMDPRMPMPTSGILGERLKAHLDAGGSAICLANLESEDLAPALKDWGIEVRPNTILVHEPIKAGTGARGDFIEDARRRPPIFILNEYGDHPLTTPLRTLDGAFVPVVAVTKTATAPEKVKVTQILPMPANPKAWGETDQSFLRPEPGTRPEDPTFDAATDLPGPVYGGAVAEKEGAGRLVVIGSQNFIINDMLSIPDMDLREKSNIEVARFPGNGELFTNSIFWLAKQDSMMALGPAALDTARIEAVPEGKLRFIKVGLVLVVLPLLAVVAGISVWFTRRG